MKNYERPRGRCHTRHPPGRTRDSGTSGGARGVDESYKGEDNVYTTYEGSGGVPVSSFFRQLLFSLRFRSFKVLLSDDITNESRVMFHRQLSERVRGSPHSCSTIR